jgi:protein-S-isoprenylcysteine O-methyltransferase Ste14
MSSDITATPSRPTWFRGFIQGKTRIVLAWIFAGLLVLSARQYPTWPGILLCFFGATLRYWASGYLRKDSRPAAGGPYAFVRNPLYLGTYLMAVGTALAIENLALFAAATVLFAVIYHYIILDEETKLVRIFGAPYEVYCRLVPRFFPRPTTLFWPPSWTALRAGLLGVNPEAAHHHFSPELARKNKALEAYWSFLGLIGLVTLLAYGWQHI